MHPRSVLLSLACTLAGLTACGPSAPEGAPPAAQGAATSGAARDAAPDVGRGAGNEPAGDAGADAAALAGAPVSVATGFGPFGDDEEPVAEELPAGDVIPAGLHAGDGTARMVARLAEIRRRTNPGTDHSLNAQRVTMWEQRLAQAEKTGKPTQQIRFQLASDKLGAGRSEEAANELAALMAKLDAKGGGVKPEFRSHVIQCLAIAWMRVGEQGNCILHHGTDSCLMPISAAGRHADETGSRKAMEVLTRILREDPKDYGSRWLLNVGAMTVGEWPDKVPPEFLVPPSAFASEQDIGRFRDVAIKTKLADRGLAGGVCEEDFDGDGLLDLVISDWSLEHAMQYYRNTGDGTFAERSVQAGISQLTSGLNMLHADVDNDGDSDILVPRGAWKGEVAPREPLSLLLNDGHGTFRDATEDAGLLCFLSSQTAAFADYDGDGWLDLFVGSESAGKKRPSPCRLFHGNRDGTFTDVAPAAGLALVAYVKGSNWGDYDDDGDPDLAVTRMDGPPLLYRNDGGHFTDVSSQAGITGPPQSFPCWWFDYDNDGHLDLYVSGYRISNVGEVCMDYLGLPNDGVKPRLYRNRGDGTFEDVTAAMGLLHVLPAMGANWGDLDNDGWPDFYLATGEPDLRGIYPNRLFRNDGGKRFVDITTSAGMGHLQKGHGVAFGDLDNDGDQDVFVVMGGALSGDDFHRALFENPGHPGGWVTLLLQGTTSNRSAIGARIAVTVRRADGSTRTIHQLVGTGGSFGSESLQAEVGLGDATAITEVQVRWPGKDAGTQNFRDVPMGRAWRLVQGQPEPVALERHTFKLGGS